MNGSDKQIKDAINSLKSIHGHEYDKNAAWQKLELRMQNKRAGISRRPFYYGLAAAIILVCITLPFVFQKNSEREIPAPDALVAVPKQHRQILSVDTAESHVVSNKPKPRPTVPIATPLPLTPSIPDTVVTPPTTVALQADTPKPDLQLVSVPSVSKKVQVVHINEVAEILSSQPPKQDNVFISLQHRNRNYIQPSENSTESSNSGRLKIKL